MLDDSQAPTFTQLFFACCLFVFGPGFGFWTAMKTLNTNISSLASFAFGAFCAYAGWFVSGMVAIFMFPDYPFSGPSEGIASSFVIPGFVTGIYAPKFMRSMLARYMNDHGGSQ